MAKKRNKADGKPRNTEVAVTTAHSDEYSDGPDSRIACGSYSDGFNQLIIKDLALAMRRPESDEEENLDKRFLLAVQGLVGIKPKNELEAMIGAQMIASHAAAMICHNQASSAAGFESQEKSMALAAKASNTFSQLTNTLLKLRGKSGKQTIHVHHHHTDARTQVAADSATINIGRDGEPRSGQVEKGTQPHEQNAIEHNSGETIDFGAAVRSKDKKRDALPVSGDKRQKAV